MLSVRPPGVQPAEAAGVVARRLVVAVRPLGPPLLAPEVRVAVVERLPDDAVVSDLVLRGEPEAIGAPVPEVAAGGGRAEGVPELTRHARSCMRTRVATVRGPVRIASWNVNSVKQRVPRLLPWLDERRPDVVCLQETKLTDEAFLDLLGDELEGRGYEVAVHGEATWNGVAILSRVGLDDVVAGLDGAPGFPGPESRAIAATCGGVRLVSVYVPNGRVPGSEHYEYKLAWLGVLRDIVAEGRGVDGRLRRHEHRPDRRRRVRSRRLRRRDAVTPPERAALAELQSLGLRDVVRDRWPGERIFTYWDYRAGMFHQDLGMRIDLVLAGEPIAERVRAAWVNRQARKGSGPSDHAPVIVDLDEAPDGDIGPVVPPPSRPVVKRGAKKLPQAKS